MGDTPKTSLWTRSGSRRPSNLRWSRRAPTVRALKSPQRAAQTEPSDGLRRPSLFRVGHRGAGRVGTRIEAGG